MARITNEITDQKDNRTLFKVSLFKIIRIRSDPNVCLVHLKELIPQGYLPLQYARFFRIANNYFVLKLSLENDTGGSKRGSLVLQTCFIRRSTTKPLEPSSFFRNTKSNILSLDNILCILNFVALKETMPSLL